MNNKRCEITVALYGDTSDCSTVPDAKDLPLYQYFVAAYAMRDAYYEENGWHFPVILRFEETDILVEKATHETAVQIQVCETGAHSLKIDGHETSFCTDACPYISRVNSLDEFAGKRLHSLALSEVNGGSLVIILDESSIRIT